MVEILRPADGADDGEGRVGRWTGEAMRPTECSIISAQPVPNPGTDCGCYRSRSRDPSKFGKVR
jgi:hypothetical protein